MSQLLDDLATLEKKVMACTLDGAILFATATEQFLAKHAAEIRRNAEDAGAFRTRFRDALVEWALPLDDDTTIDHRTLIDGAIMPMFDAARAQEGGKP